MQPVWHDSLYLLRMYHHSPETRFPQSFTGPIVSSIVGAVLAQNDMFPTGGSNDVASSLQTLVSFTGSIRCSVLF
jgi:hypothetical protein